MEVEKLIDALKKARADGSWNTLSDLSHKAANALEQLQAENDRLKEEVQQMRWIPVEERLPEEEGTYIVCVDDEVKYDAYCILEGIERWLCYDGSINALYIEPYSGKPLRKAPYPRVTHWMPLPKPPKEASHD